jgi:dienelactone hydrolase
MRSLLASSEDRLAPLIKSGRAAFAVVLMGYSGRLYPAGRVPPDPKTVEYLESFVHRITDLRRGLDYLESRQDIDASRIGYYGISAGAQLGLLAAGVETRYRSVALLGSGLGSGYAGRIPDANPVNFAAHIRGPKLMIQGRYDEDTPLKTAAEPLYKLLPDPKRLVVFDGGHIPSDDILVPTLTAWLDETLGRVQR